MIQLLAPITDLFAISSQCVKQGFFGLKPWYYYLPSDRFDLSNGGCNIKNFQFLPSGSSSGGDIPLVIMAIVDDLLRIAAIVAVAYIIVGAAQMITSQGNPEKAAQARSTIINALIGLAVAVVAAGFVAFIGAQLG